MPRLFLICMFLLGVLLQQSLRLAEWPESHATAVAASESAREGEAGAPEDGAGERVAEDVLSWVGSNLPVGSAAPGSECCGWATGLSRGRTSARALFKPPRA